MDTCGRIGPPKRPAKHSLIRMGSRQLPQKAPKTPPLAISPTPISQGFRRFEQKKFRLDPAIRGWLAAVGVSCRTSLSRKRFPELRGGKKPKFTHKKTHKKLTRNKKLAKIVKWGRTSKNEIASALTLDTIGHWQPVPGRTAGWGAGERCWSARWRSCCCCGSRTVRNKRIWPPKNTGR